MIIIADERVRIDKYLIDKTDYSRSKIQKMIGSGAILVNGDVVKNSYSLSVGDEIDIADNYEEDIDIGAENIDLDILYEDDYLLVVNKPSGMVVHPANGNPDGTLVNAIMNLCGDTLSGIGGEIRPGIIHRLDKDTSGVLIVAKNDMAHIDISNQIKNRETKKNR